MKSRKQKIIVIVSIISIVVIGSFFGLNGLIKAEANNPTVEVTELKSEKIFEKVLTQGELKFANQQEVYALPEKGEISEILVEEGQNVEKGDPLLRYENNQLELEKQQNELQIESAKLQLNELQKQHKEIDKQLREEKSDVKNESSQNELIIEQVDGEQQSQDQQSDALQAEHDQVSLQEKQTNLELEQLEVQKESISQQTNELTVVSNVTGKVVNINEQAATLSNQIEQEPIIQIGTLDKLVVEGVISEYDTLNIEEGQPVKLTSDAVPNKSWNGKVSYISDLPKENLSSGTETVSSGVQYPVEITVNDGNIGLKPGFQMIVEIKTDEFKTLTIPSTALKQEDEDTNYVYIVNDGKVERREVTVGTTSVDSIEIKKGLNKEEQVIVEPSDDIAEGMEVTVK